MALAIFDLDDTLIHGDSASLWSREMMRLGWVEDEDFLSLDQELMNAYSQGKLAMEDYMAFSLTPMVGRTVENVAEAVAQFIKAVIDPLVYREARQTIARHKAAGDRLLVISATGVHIVSPVAAHLGIDEVLAIDLEVQDGQFTGLTEGILTYREGKVLRLSEWLRAQDEMLEGAFFYSDSRNDLPMLKLVDNPITVNPDPTLRAYAQEHGWPVLDWG
ncbi:MULTISPECIES: HAD family hydrolase [Pseudomonas]|uniref:Histidinol-phosphatase n=1 Tax=Pseudomonas viridiflava TaxID=33069 RepID=A0AA46VXI4_PSEVI|nr:MULTISPECIES: HAD family hydrolase [Pseudomonas]MBV1807307.1 HAD-IB family hydrolase [Pseudomonas viridiflava]MBV1815219.1 HAD-IB family hydrolase [Pseudomonas viridiflava]MCI3911602.1 HAD-IB family hydrolase [Pseudomonas viridiflava]MEE4077678.1 HAD family hydrolase [Pseudomonas viridiflava]MEE4085267.1 HAD family hydrolase [Pseudomonas viridiflava]